MTTYFPFTPSPLRAFQFTPTLDGSPYSGTIVWGLFGQRWFLNLTALDGTQIVYLPVIESPASNAIDTAVWENGFVTVQTLAPHGYTIGATIALIVSGCAPTGYNGNWAALVVDDETLQFPLVGDPGPLTQAGIADWIVNMVSGYFATSTLAYRNGQFEVNP